MSLSYPLLRHNPVDIGMPCTSVRPAPAALCRLCPKSPIQFVFVASPRLMNAVPARITQVLCSEAAHSEWLDLAACAMPALGDHMPLLHLKRTALQALDCSCSWLVAAVSVADPLQSYWEISTRCRMRAWSAPRTSTSIA
jgi:hypothetical protein